MKYISYVIPAETLAWQLKDVVMSLGVRCSAQDKQKPNEC